MASTSWENEDTARDALRFIVSDPGYGVAALSSPQTMSSLLKDLLPDAPREKSVLIAASEAGVAGMLRDHMIQGMDLATASALAVASFTRTTGYPDDVGNWVVGELAQAIGFAPSPIPPGPVSPGPAGPGPGPGLQDTILPGAFSRDSMGPAPQATVPPMSYPQNTFQQNTYGPGPSPYETVAAGGNQGAGVGGWQQGSGGGSQGGGRRSSLWRILAAAGGVVVVIVGIVLVIHAVSPNKPTKPTKPTKPGHSTPATTPAKSTTPAVAAGTVEPLSQIMSPMVTPSSTGAAEVTSCGSTSQSGFHGITADVSCTGTATSGDFKIWSYQFDNASDYQGGLKHLDSFTAWDPAGAVPGCSSDTNTTCSALWWRTDEQKYRKRPGQILQEHYVNNSNGTFPTFIWTMPTQRVVFISQDLSKDSTLPELYSWWGDLVYG